MKKSYKNLKLKTAIHATGWLIAAAAIYFSVKNLDMSSMRRALGSMNSAWIYPIVILNFVVISLKALRWQITFKPVKDIRFLMIFKVLVIGFMANNVLPARLGDILRIYLMGKDAVVSKITATTTLIADRAIEVVSFLILAAGLVLFADVPEWIKTGLIITLFITMTAYTLLLIYSAKEVERPFFKKLQDGIQSLRQPKYVTLGIIASLLSWILQAFLIYMTQLAFGVVLPVWGTFLVLVAVNLAIALPSAPSNIGTFEFACILAYTYLGVDKSLGLLIGITYHLLQVVPVTLAGGMMLLWAYLGGRKVPATARGPEISC